MSLHSHLLTYQLTHLLTKLLTYFFLDNIVLVQCRSKWTKHIHDKIEINNLRPAADEQSPRLRELAKY